MSDVLDETYQRLHRTGPEFVGWLSNHGPMAADALVRLGRGEEVERWVGEYAKRLDAEPAARWPIESHDRGNPHALVAGEQAARLLLPS